MWSDVVYGMYIVFLLIFLKGNVCCFFFKNDLYNVGDVLYK